METIKSLLGFAFFLFAAALAAVPAWHSGNVLAWAAALHNLLLAVIYLLRRPAGAYDRTGLWLGLIAALLPTASGVPDRLPWLLALVGLAGYALILWSLWALGPSFGIAPADRGLVACGPYRLVRHPMYLGELALRFTLVTASPNPVWAAVVAIALMFVQVARIRREEGIIAGYGVYAGQVRWRLLPGVW